MKGILPLLFATAALAIPAHAQNATTTPVGAMTYTINAYSTKAIALPLQDSISLDFVGRSSGVISSLTSNTITATEAGWTPGALSVAATPFFIKITSGAQEGRLLEISTSVAAQNTATTVTVANQGTDLSTLGILTGATGDTFQIIPADTLGSLFGTSTFGGTSYKTSDNIQRWTGVNWQTFYYNTANNRWQSSTSTNSANNVILRPDTGYLYVRRGSTPINLAFYGTVPIDPAKIIVRNSGGSYIGNSFPVDVALSTFSGIPGWVSTDSPTTSDRVSRWNGTQWQKFYFDSVDNRWELTTTRANASAVKIAFGTPVMIERVGTAPGIATLSQPLPYNPFLPSN